MRKVRFPSEKNSSATKQKIARIVILQCSSVSTMMTLATVYILHFLHLRIGLAAFVLGSSQILFIVEHPLDVTFPSENKENQIYL